MNQEILSVTWFNPGADSKVVGVIVVKDSITQERKAYIGTGDGYSEDADIRKIMDWGAKLHEFQLHDILATVKQPQHEEYKPDGSTIN